MQPLWARTRVFGSILVRSQKGQDKETGVALGNAMPALAGGALGAFNPAPWVILLLPILLAAVNSAWIFTSPSWIDAWVYFGYFQHLTAYKSTLFPNLYYGSRLPWILPGYVAYRFLEPKIANIVLHFAFYYAATFSFHSLLRRAVGSRNALLGTILFGTYAQFLSAIGWDYVDGAGATYFLLALAAVARATEIRSRLWLLGSGVTGLAMCYTNLFLVAFLPFVPGLYFFLMVKGWRSVVRILTDLIVWFGAGAILISVVLGIINYKLDGSFWFYWPSIFAAIGFHSRPNPWVAHGWAWLRGAYWLGIPAAATVATLAYAVRDAVRRALRVRDLRTFLVFQFLVIMGGMVAWQIIGATGLYWFYYASYIIPAMFLAIGCILAGEGDEQPTFAWWAVIVGSIAVFALSLWMANGEWVHVLRVKFSMIALSEIAAACLICNVLFWKKWYLVLLAVAGLGIYQSGYSGLDNPSTNYEVGWRHVVDGANAVWPYEQKRPVSFWYDTNAPHGLEFYSINAVYLWGYTYVGTEFPKIEDRSRLIPGATIVLQADSPNWVDRANDVLRANHVRGTPLGTDTIGHDANAFKIGFLTLESYPASNK